MNNQAIVFSCISLGLGVIGFLVSRILPEGIVLSLLGLALAAVSGWYYSRSPNTPSLILLIVAVLVCGLPFAVFLERILPRHLIQQIARFYLG